MSSSERTGAASADALLIASGPPGVEIQILDGAYRPLSRGSETLKASLPQGLYVVRWLSPDGDSDEIVRLLPVRKALRVAYAPKAVAPANPALDLIQPAPRARRHAAEIVVLEQSEAAGPPGLASRGLRLYDLTETAMRSDRSAVDAERGESGEGESGGWALRVYPVPPGPYRLRCQAADGRTINQTVAALEGRRTVVLLRLSVAQVLVPQGATHAVVSFSGVDPTRTVIATTPLGRAGAPAADQLRLVESLLGGLARGGDALSQAVLRRIEAANADPLLRLYAVAAILSALDHGVSPAMDDAWPAAPDAEAEFRSRWRATAARLLAPLDAVLHDNADVAACRLALGGDAARIEAPPMLAWSWAAAPAPTEADSFNLRGAAAGHETAGPWLVWSAAAAKGGEVTADRRRAARRVDQEGTTLGAEPVGSGALVQWAPVAGVAALAALVYAATSLPASVELGPMADQAAALQVSNWPMVLAALAAVAAGVLGGRRLIAAWRRYAALRRTPPALDLPVVNFDDPHKGRFGGSAAAGGFSLSAVFDEDGGGWVRVELTVRRDAPGSDAAEPAVFCLHPTFDPDRVARAFERGRARLTLRAYGGFTVGVWLPRSGVQLELDLSTLPDAPRVIREL